MSYIPPEINLFPEAKTLRELPSETLTHKTVLLCVIGSLAWDYADTILDLAAQMKLRNLSGVSRAVREIKTEYESFQLRSLSRKDLASLERLAFLFEDVCNEHFSRLSLSLQNEKEIRECRADFRYLVVSVQMAMTVIDAMRLYTADFSAYLRNNGVKGKSVEIAQFGRLAQLLPQYAGDAYNADSPARRLTAKILFNELKQYERDGIESDGAYDA